jgi:opacity protein-like surface antigen
MRKLIPLTGALTLVLALATAADARIRRSAQNPAERFAFVTHFGAFVPTGDFGDAAQTGFRWNTAFEYYPSRDAALGLDFSFAEADARDFLRNDERRNWEDIFGPPVQINTFNYHTYRLGIFGRYNVPTGTRISPYLEAGTGIYWINRRVSGAFQQGGSFFEFSDRRTHTTAGGNLGAGINAQLGPRTNLYTGFQFHQLFDETPSRNYATFTMGLGVHLGSLR